MSNCECQCHEPDPGHVTRVSHGCRKRTQVLWSPAPGTNNSLFNKDSVTTHSHFCEPRDGPNNVGGSGGIMARAWSTLKIVLASWCAFTVFFVAKNGLARTSGGGQCSFLKAPSSRDVNLDFLITKNGWKTTLTAVFAILGAVNYWHTRRGTKSSDQDFSKLFFLLGALVSSSVTVLYFASWLNQVEHWHLFRLNFGVVLAIMAAFGLMALTKDLLTSHASVPALKSAATKHSKR